MAKKSEQFIPGEETDEHFEKVLELLVKWTKEKIVDIEVDTDGDVDFNLPKEMKELLATQIPKELTQKNVTSIIRTEIPFLISAGFSKDPKKHLKRRLPEDLHKKIQELEKRSDKVIDTLITDVLRQRIKLRTVAAGYLIDDVKWNQASYHLKNGNREERDVPYISMQIKFAKPGSPLIMSVTPKEAVINLSRSDDIIVNLELHREDLNDFIKKLKIIAEKINI